MNAIAIDRFINSFHNGILEPEMFVASGGTFICISIDPLWVNKCNKLPQAMD